IGASIAHALSNHGVKVVLSGRNESRLNAVAKRIQEEVQIEVDTLTVDVTQKSDIERLVRHTQEKFGRVDILVNSAGKMLSSAITDDDVDAWDTMLDVNVKGTLYGIHAVLPEFLNQSSAHITNISSISGFEATTQSALYS
ncbi:oxidoreductase, partial [Staphylococcus saprophyticus]